MILPQTRGNRVHLRLRLLHADARPQLADDVVVFVIAVLSRIGGHGKRQHHLGLLGPIKRGHDLARQKNDRGITPTTSYGSPLSVIVLPRISGSEP